VTTTSNAVPLTVTGAGGKVVVVVAAAAVAVCRHCRAAGPLT